MLDETRNSPGYLLGRLFAILCDLEAATGNKHHSDTDLYGRLPTAIGNPTVVLNYVAQQRRFATRLAQTSPAKADRFTTRITGLVERVGQPGMLTGNTAEQSLFTIGYWHQVGADIETMPTSAVAELLGYTGANATNAARAELSRLGVEAIGRDAQTGEKLWPITEVGEAVRRRPGQGARTDKRRQA
jgi:hypothetical protein